MKIVCSKEEFAEMLTHCVTNVNETVYRACTKCVLCEICDGAYVDRLTEIIEIEKED